MVIVRKMDKIDWLDDDGFEASNKEQLPRPLPTNPDEA
jgi:nitrate reductase alpha subunit